MQYYLHLGVVYSWKDIFNNEQLSDYNVVLICKYKTFTEKHEQPNLMNENLGSPKWKTSSHR